MLKMMTDQMGEEAERKQIEAWREKHKVTPQAYSELLTILYRKQVLTKGETP